MSNFTPVMRNSKAFEIKQILQMQPRMVCVLNTDGILKIYNAEDIQTVLQSAETFTEANAEETLNVESGRPQIVSNHVVTLPGRVH